MKRLSLTILCLALALLSCKKEDDDPPPTENQPQPDVASGSVTSADSARIQSPAGAYIDVPAGAVPLTTDSSSGTMIFSIEKLATPPEIVNPPAGMTRVGSAYRFGPAGFVFERPVEIAIPVSGEYQIGEILLARINPTTREPEIASADYDPTAGVIKAQTTEMSDWEIFQGASPALAWARVRVNLNFTPPSSTQAASSARICVENFNPQFPTDTASLHSPVFDLRSGASRVWTIPQGTYQLCIQFMWITPAFTQYSSSYTLPSLAVQNLDGWIDNPQLVNATMTIDQSHFDASTPDSRCACNRRSTPSPGTGELQVTLTWYNEDPLDLDLWVTDPSGERCYYANTPTESGGALDRDNLCANYINGAPENIFWRTAPNGTYTVEVNWFSSCGNSNNLVQNFAVRVAGEGLNPITESRQIEPNTTVTVGQYTLSGGAVIQRLPVDPTPRPHAPNSDAEKQALHDRAAQR